jgi:hypothetical protein
MESSSAVRVIEKNEPDEAHAGTGAFEASLQMAKRSGSTNIVNSCLVIVAP